MFKIASVLLCISMIAALFTGCDNQQELDAGQPTPAASPSAVPFIPEQSDPALMETETPAEGQTAMLYIGTKAAGFQEYSLTYEGDLTPEVLIQGIADLTGWDLTLAEVVTIGKGGMSVCLSSASTLFVGPPEPQKDEFHMYDSTQLAETILDSIQKTLQEDFTGEGGDPDTLDIWYYMEGEKPLELPEIDRSWPIDQPYQWAAG